MAIEIVSLPINSMVLYYSYLKLLEGESHWHPVPTIIIVLFHNFPPRPPAPGHHTFSSRARWFSIAMLVYQMVSLLHLPAAPRVRHLPLFDSFRRSENGFVAEPWQCRLINGTDHMMIIWLLVGFSYDDLWLYGWYLWYLYSQIQYYQYCGCIWQY